LFVVIISKHIIKTGDGSSSLS